MRPGSGPVPLPADPDAPSPFDRAVRREVLEKVRESLQVLEPRERRILELRFGIGDDKEKTLEEVGRSIGLSRERVRQIEARLKKKLGNYLREQIPDIRDIEFGA